jgi:hypothetical protein
MDYLDPTKKKRKKNQLLIMYILLGIAIGIATLVVVYNVNGYSIDRETGEVVQNGLLYLDAKPGSAEVFLNGEKQRGKTDARLVVAEGTYDVEMRRDGYLPWKRNLVLEGGSLRRLTYARLVPETIESEAVREVDVEPSFMTQSIDKRWLVALNSTNPTLFYVYDLERTQDAPANIQMPTDTLASSTGGTWKVIDWADDNKTMLASYTVSGSKPEFLLINREDGAKVVNITKTFPTLSISDVVLRARKNNTVYVFDQKLQIVYQADINAKTSQAILTDVIDYVSYGTDTFTYVTTKDAKDGMVRAVLQHEGKEYPLRDLTVSDKYLLDTSRLGNALIVAIGSKGEDRVIVYNDPINALEQNESSNLPVPTTVLRVVAPEELRISADSSALFVRSGSQIATHEFEADRSYSFETTSKLKLGSELQWVDGQHLLGVNEANKLLMLDFDGSNQFELVDASNTTRDYFSRTMNELYTLKAGEDGKPSMLTRYFMRTKADRQ